MKERAVLCVDDNPRILSAEGACSGVRIISF
jgi:hypothetical protein